MNKQNDFITYIKNSMLDMKLERYSKIFDSMLKIGKTNNEIIVTPIIEAAYCYFNDILPSDELILVNDIIKNKVDKLEPKIIRNKYQFKFLSNILTKCYVRLYKFVDNKTHISNEELYNNYQELINTYENDKTMFINFEFLSKQLIEYNTSLQHKFDIVLSFINMNLERFNEVDINSVIENCTIINKYYSDDIKQSDINIIYESLLKLNIEKELCDKFLIILNKKVEKSKNKKQEKVVYNKFYTKPSISKKDIYSITNELNSYFDFKNMKVKKILSLDETIYCLSLLYKLSADNKTIDKFLMLTNKEKRKQNPIYVYIDLYDKLINSNNKEILNLVDSINYELSKMFICSNDEYNNIKDNISEHIKYLLNIVDFEYEKSKVKIIK
ncbi:MAG: hypothetical protein E7170_01415 [Firmicutes bacterium]|nr:hypothetical protein [Bacillota bacterium]